MGGIGSCPLLCGSQELNPSCQAWWQVPAAPSGWRQGSFYLFFILVALGIKPPRASHMPGKSSAVELPPVTGSFLMYVLWV